MAGLHYTAILDPEEEGGYHAFCPVLKGCHSYGDTVEEAVANLKEAVTVYLESLRADGEPVPHEEFLVTWVEVTA